MDVLVLPPIQSRLFFGRKLSGGSQTHARLRIFCPFRNSGFHPPALSHIYTAHPALCRRSPGMFGGLLHWFSLVLRGAGRGAILCADVLCHRRLPSLLLPSLV